MRVLSLAAALALALPVTAEAATYSFDFDRITANSPTDASGQLSVVADDFGTVVKFTFSVLAGSQMNASIAEIYFSDLGGIFAPPPAILFESGVKYVAGSANPGELPGANNATPDFVTTTGLLADNVSQGGDGNANAIQINDLLILGLTFNSGFDFADLLGDIEDGDFRIGLHVRSLQNGQSDSFVSTAAIPLPAAGWALLMALGGLGLAARRRRAA